MPEPTPVEGMSTRPRADTPCDVIVTTELRTAATTVGRSVVAIGPGFVPVAVVTPAGAPGLGAGVVCAVRSGPATRAAVPPAARIADSRAAPRMAAVPPERDRARRTGAGAADGAAEK